jgi:hypothetical protein
MYGGKKMFLARIIRKLIWSAIGFVIVAIIGFVGYVFFDEDGEDVNVDQNIENQQTFQDGNQSNDQVLAKPMYNLPPSSELPLQQTTDGTYKEGIYYFTAQNPVGLTIDPGYNAWLIQLPSKLGKKIEVERIEKSGINYDIYVNMRADNTSEFAFKPSFGFFQVRTEDMPTYGKFRIYDVDNPSDPIWPKY